LSAFVALKQIVRLAGKVARAGTPGAARGPQGHLPQQAVFIGSILKQLDEEWPSKKLVPPATAWFCRANIAAGVSIDMAAKTAIAKGKGAPKTTMKGAAKAAPIMRPVTAAKPASSKAPRPAVKSAAVKATARSPVKAAVKSVTPTTVTLKHLATGLAERHDMPKKQADTLLADLFGQLVDHLKSGERVRISGLGIIEVKNRPARMGRNPATGEAIQIKDSKKVAFRAAKELKDAI
jgi:DNA-binding protein HU-beta